MANFRTVLRHRKVNPWFVYDELPIPVRAALQEGPTAWDPVGVRRQLNKWTKVHGRAEAVKLTAAWINRAHQAEIEYAMPWNGNRRLPPEHRRLSPHLMAEATMQLSNREEY
jgi:Family of unknown function (DUF6525)